MKKVKYLLLLLFIPASVFATEKEYRFFYLEKEYSKEFYEEGKNNEEYPYKSSIWKYNDTLKTATEKPQDEMDIVEEVPILKYQEQEKVRYIIIDQTYSDSKINLQEIEVYNKEDKIEYKVQCDTCPTEFFSLIQNTKVDYEYNYINDNSKIIIDLQKEYFPDDLILKIYLNGVTNKIARFRVTVNNTNNLNDKYYRFEIEKKLAFLIKVAEPLKNIEHESRYSEDIQVKKGIKEIENAKIVELTTEYTYKTREYLYYKEIRHYIDGYYEELNGLIKDEESFRIKEAVKTEEMQEEIKQEEPKQELPKEEIIKIEYLTKEIKVPVIHEKIKYVPKEIYVEVPKEIEKVIEKEIIKEPQTKKENYLFRYGIYLLFTPMLRKMLKFKG